MTSPTNEQRIFKWRVIEIEQQQKNRSTVKWRSMHAKSAYFDSLFPMQFPVYLIFGRFCWCIGRWTQKYKQYVEYVMQPSSVLDMYIDKQSNWNSRCVIQNWNKKQLDEFEMDTQIKIRLRFFLLFRGEAASRRVHRRAQRVWCSRIFFSIQLVYYFWFGSWHFILLYFFCAAVVVVGVGWVPVNFFSPLFLPQYSYTR